MADATSEEAGIGASTHSASSGANRSTELKTTSRTSCAPEIPNARSVQATRASTETPGYSFTAMHRMLGDLFGYRTSEYYEELIKLSRVTLCQTEQEIEHMKQNRASYSRRTYKEGMEALVATLEDAKDALEWAEACKNWKPFMDGEYRKVGPSGNGDNGVKKPEGDQKAKLEEDQEEGEDQEQDLDLLKGWAY